jgi:hypothetical protein
MRYLAKARSHEVRAKVDTIWGSKKLKSAAVCQNKKTVKN